MRFIKLNPLHYVNGDQVLEIVELLNSNSDSKKKIKSFVRLVLVNGKFIDVDAKLEDVIAVFNGHTKQEISK